MSHELHYLDGEQTAEVVLSGPNGNALDRAGIESLQQVLTEAAARPGTRSVILSGSGGSFCGGRIRDLSLKSAGEIATDLAPIIEMNRLIESYPLPLIAAVEGSALGFGFGLSTLCDYTIVAADARLALTELAHGIPPLIVLSYLFRYVPYKVAFDLALSGRDVGATEARALGLATEVRAPGETLGRAREVAAQIAAVDPVAIGLLREYARRNAALVDDVAATEGAAKIAALLASHSA